MSPLHAFVEGALALSYLVAAGFFLRFWTATRDRLFACFSGAFLLMAASRLALSLLDVPESRLPWFYVVRLASYGLIIWGIVAKNLVSAKR